MISYSYGLKAARGVVEEMMCDENLNDFIITVDSFSSTTESGYCLSVTKRHSEMEMHFWIYESCDSECIVVNWQEDCENNMFSEATRALRAKLFESRCYRKAADFISDAINDECWED